jgi:hypothetical protein
MSEPVSFPDAPLSYPGAPVPAGASVVLPLLPSRYAPMPSIGDGRIPGPGEATNPQVSEAPAALPELMLSPGDSHDYQPFSFYRVPRAVEHNALVEAATREPDSPRADTTPGADRPGVDAGAVLTDSGASDHFEPEVPAPNPGALERSATAQVPPTALAPTRDGSAPVTDQRGASVPGQSEPEAPAPNPGAPEQPVTGQVPPTTSVPTPQLLPSHLTPGPSGAEGKQSPSAASGIASVASLFRNDDFATAPIPTRDRIAPVTNQRGADVRAARQPGPTAAGAAAVTRAASGAHDQSGPEALAPNPGAPEQPVTGQGPLTTPAPTPQLLPSHLTPVPSGAEGKQSPAAASGIASVASLLRNDDFAAAPIPTRDRIMPVADQRGADVGAVRQPGSTTAGAVAVTRAASGAHDQSEPEALAPNPGAPEQPVTGQVPPTTPAPTPQLLPSHLMPVPSGAEGKQSPAAASGIASVASLLRNDDLAATLVPTRAGITPVTDERGANIGAAPRSGPTPAGAMAAALADSRSPGPSESEPPAPNPGVPGRSVTRQVPPTTSTPTNDGRAPVTDRRGTQPGSAPAIGTGVPTRNGEILPLLRPAVEQAPTGATPRQAGRRMDMAANEPPPLPTIRVTIGRVEVRAAQQAAQQAALARVRPQPALSLDDILRTRGGRP